IAAAHVAVLGAIAYRAVAGDVDAGAVAVYVQAVGAIAVLGHGSVDLWWIRQGAAALPHLRELAERTGRVGRLGGAAPAPALRHAVRFENVGFAYPGTDRVILDGLQLELRAGESLAVVGENGAGKSTILKLLARLYDPTSGAVTVDGRDLRELEPQEWRRQIAVISQTFIRYEATARDNVAFGVGRASELQEAARLAGASPVIDALPAGWDTVLSRRYAGGVDLSGGQWQRIALARALYAARTGARILVLDEPTAHLDVRAEAELFERFLELTAGLTTVLVTHRLSTVRYADRIAVLGDGRVRETGTHADLVRDGGPYSRMFSLQAERFSHD
ncbi:MAG TPA: ABC transporter ATP-binding protein, partial [Mycobacteriales bacterium]|nr:ABC transporter ATP-binding protein [Mycobacteriales bacterium]